MNEIVKNSIEARKNAIFSSYEITDKSILDRIDEYFNRLNKWAEKYDDVMKFETDSGAFCGYSSIFTVPFFTNSAPNCKNVSKGQKFGKECMSLGSWSYRTLLQR